MKAGRFFRNSCAVLSPSPLTALSSASEGAAPGRSGKALVMSAILRWPKPRPNALLATIRSLHVAVASRSRMAVATLSAETF